MVNSCKLHIVGGKNWPKYLTTGLPLFSLPDDDWQEEHKRLAELDGLGAGLGLGGGGGGMGGEAADNGGTEDSSAGLHASAAHRALPSTLPLHNFSSSSGLPRPG